MVSPQKIKYNGVFVDTIFGTPENIIFDVAFDSDNGAMSSYLNRSAVASESHDGRYKNTHKYKYDELFSPQFTIVKKDFSDFTKEEVRKVLKCLTITDKPAMLEVYYDNTGVVDWACIGGWTSIETYKIANNRTVGIVAKFEAITPYAMSGKVNNTKTINSATDNKITITINTDEPSQPVFPKITIEQKGSVVNIPTGTTYSSVVDMADKIENTAYYNGSTYYWKTTEPQRKSGTSKPQYKDPINGEIKYYDWTEVEINHEYGDDDVWEMNTIYKYNNNGNIKYYWLDPYDFHSSKDNPYLKTTSVKITNVHKEGSKETSTSPVIVKNNAIDERIVIDGANKIVSSSNHYRIFGDNFNFQWLELYEGTNEITIEGNCTVTLEWQTVVKCGEY